MVLTLPYTSLSTGVFTGCSLSQVFSSNMWPGGGEGGVEVIYKYADWQIGRGIYTFFVIGGIRKSAVGNENQ